MGTPNLTALSAAMTDSSLGDRIHAALILVASQQTYEGDAAANEAAQTVFGDPSGEGHKYRLAVIAHPTVMAALPDPSDEVLISAVTQLWERGTFQ